MAVPDEIRAGLEALVAERFPGASIVSVRALGKDARAEPTSKAAGYGEPILIELRKPGGERAKVVFHTAKADSFGHDRRADRAYEQILSFDTFGEIPNHVRAVDVGAIGRSGRFLSLADAGELYLVTEYGEGTPYAEDLRRIAHGAGATARELARVRALSHYLAELHRRLPPNPDLYRRAIRDLVGHGEGIFGIVDGYPEDTPGASPQRLAGIERRCVEWRWQLRGKERRLSRTHGDFHPFNILFHEGVGFSLLDASRGCAGDPADDLCALAVNFVFFALGQQGAWQRGLGELWRVFWRDYLAATGDREVLEVAAPFFAWRGLVVCNPRFYPALPAQDRDRMLTLVERALDAPRLELSWPDELFR